MIANNYEKFSTRTVVPIYKKIKNNEVNHLTSIKKIVEYQYYICDFCKKEIKIRKNLYEQNGGIAIIPATVTKKQSISLALCNGCLKKVLSEFEEGRNAS